MPIEPNAKDRVFAESAATSADTNVLATNVTPSDSPTVLELWMAVNTSAQPKLAEWNGSALQTYDLNGGSTIGASALHNEPVGVREGSEYNVQFGADVKVELLNVDERGYYEG